MRSLLIDELSPKDVEKVRSFLESAGTASEIRGLYWITLPQERLSPLQKEHRECGPHKFAVELDDDWLKIEFLIRPAAGLRCTCCNMADREQREHILAWADGLIESLDLAT